MWLNSLGMGLQEKVYLHNCLLIKYGKLVLSQVHAYHWNRTGYKVVGHTPLYHRLLVTSKFCLATQVCARVGGPVCKHADKCMQLRPSPHGKV